jgi:hypothetical protein
MPIGGDSPYRESVIELRGAGPLQKVPPIEKCPRSKPPEAGELLEITRHKKKLDGTDRAHLQRTGHVVV